MPLNSTRGAGSAKGFGLTSGAKPWDGNDVDYLIVAGGGGGSWAGGGAGGFRTFTSQSLTANSPYPVTIGAGGVGPPDNVPLAQSGSPSSFNSETSTGGGGGSGFTGGGAAGGSGGGGGGFSPTQGGAGNSPPVSPPQGNNGGNGNTDVVSFTNGGAGGGAGGGAAPNGGSAGVGSPVTSIFGAAPQPFYLSDIPTAGAVSGGYFAGGGAGVNQQPGAAPLALGAIGGGGNTEESGVQNSGGGAGGVAYNPKSGGSGIVLIKVPSTVNVTVTPGTNTVTTVGASKIAKFTVSGTFLGK